MIFHRQAPRLCAWLIAGTSFISVSSASAVPPRSAPSGEPLDLFAPPFSSGDSDVFRQACDLTCDPGSLLENEPDCGEIPGGIDTVNGGCFSDPEVFTPVSCGNSYCSTTGFIGGVFDFDWYELNLATLTKITVTTESETPMFSWILDLNAGCAGFSTTTFSSVPECSVVLRHEEAAPLTACLAPGRYALVFRTAGAVDVTCGVDYQFDVTCGLCKGACCDTASDTCTDGLFGADCNGVGEEWSPGSKCCAEDVACGSPPPTDTASGVTLLSQLDLAQFPGAQTRGNEMWGHVSPSGREYGIIGFTKGTAFVEVTDPRNPVIVGFISGGGVDQPWRDMAVFNEHAYIVTDGAGVGLQIVDLTQIDSGVVTLVSTTTLGVGFTTAHNIAVNPDSGFAYLVLADGFNADLPVLDLTDPTNPQIAGTWSEVGLHDVLVVSYTSGIYAGREIAFGFAQGDGLKIIDVTDKSNMFTMSTLVYPNIVFTHQGWLSEDRRFVFIGDELDEDGSENVFSTTTYVANVEDLENPFLATTFTNGLCSIDHNMMVRGNHLFEANYSSGLRIFDISNINTIQEVGFYDTHPENDLANFDGAWGVYTDLPSRVVLVSDRERGLFVFDVSGATGFVDIPAVSQWGLAALVLLILAAGTILLSSRRRTRSSRQSAL